MALGARPTLEDKAALDRQHLAGGLSLSRFAEAAQSAGSELDVQQPSGLIEPKAATRTVAIWGG